MGSTPGQTQGKDARVKQSRLARRRGDSQDLEPTTDADDSPAVFDGGQPEPDKDAHIGLGEEQYLILRRDWIASRAVAAAIAMVPLCLLALLIGIPATDVALVVTPAS